MAKVRYRVINPVFVDGNYIDPRGRKDVFVTAEEGLAGRNLELVADEVEPVADEQGPPADPPLLDPPPDDLTIAPNQPAIAVVEAVVPVAPTGKTNGNKQR